MENEIISLAGLAPFENKHGNEQLLLVNKEEEVQLLMKAKNERVNC